MEQPPPYEWLLLARKYEVVEWVVPALIKLCERAVPLSLDEVRGMSMEDVVLVATVREDIRSKAIQFGVSPAKISVKATQAGTPETPILAAVYDSDEFAPEVAPESPTDKVAEGRVCSPVNVTRVKGLGVRSGRNM